MRILVSISLLIFLSVGGFCQNRAANWYFGNNAGVEFLGEDVNVLTDGELVAHAGCATISNLNGDLLFYTNGAKVWNRDHSIMANGDSLIGSQLVNQNSIIVPLPNSDSLYYLFTINNIDSICGFNYSVIDMSKGGGLGRVVTKNVLIKNNVLEKIAAVEHCNGIDYWILIHGLNNHFYSYLLTESGFQFDSIVSNVGTMPKSDIGYLKVSPAGNSIVIPINSDDVIAEMYTFNNRTGVVSNPVKLYAKHQNTYCYGVEYSPDGNMLYITTRGASYSLWQYNCRNKNELAINNSALKIADGNNFAMQVAPNGKIYIASENRPYLNAINNPNEIGTECNYESEAVEFSQSTSLMGLPNFVQSWLYKPTFDTENNCIYDTTLLTFNQLSNTDSLVWILDGTIITKHNNEIFLEYYFMDVGKYNVKLKIFHCNACDSVDRIVEIFPYPVSNLTTDTTICNNCTVTLDAGAGFDYYSWNIGSSNRFLTITNQGEYWVEISKKGCSTIDTVLITKLNPIIELPNAFTPNGDGLNDEFKVINSNDIVDFEMWIMDRRGAIVFHNKSIYEGWDGTFQGKRFNHQTFVWNIVYSYYNKSGNIIREFKKGTVTTIY